MGKIIHWVCEECGREFDIPEEDYEDFITAHRYLHDIVGQIGIQITWDGRKYHAYDINTGKELFRTDEDNSLLI